MGLRLGERTKTLSRAGNRLSIQVTHAGVSARLGWGRRRGRNWYLAALGLLTLVLVSLLASLVQPVEATNVADLTITEGETAERDYGPIAGSSPHDSNTTGNPPGRAPSNCDPGVHCDVIDLTVNVPSSYGRFDLWSVVATLSWPSPSTNNMNLYMYDVNRTTLVRSSATANHPERVEVAEPPSGRYYLVVLNESGANTGYKVRAEFIYKGQIDEPFIPESEASGSDVSGGADDPNEFGFADLNPALPLVPAAGTVGGEPRLVETPGPDGPTTKARLAALGVASGFKDATSRNSMILGGVATAIVLTFGTVLFIRHRKSIYEEGLAKA